jgi:hypothetical protein
MKQKKNQKLKQKLRQKKAANRERSSGSTMSISQARKRVAMLTQEGFETEWIKQFGSLPGGKAIAEEVPDAPDDLDTVVHRSVTGRIRGALG